MERKTLQNEKSIVMGIASSEDNQDGARVITVLPPTNVRFLPDAGPPLVARFLPNTILLSIIRFSSDIYLMLDFCPLLDFYLTESFRPPSPDDYGPSDLRRPPTTVLPAPVARRLWSF
ncbi:hypothetical protein MA16_Dca008897 [Dendrobium catenatum]|uniref:Uncharacterized protein n=1 Tax=Dendrobium catenatum TaxID=906689 RepID=A0A2I0VUK9_9ASPA|nr:hypothetical protein MA16_Dca008897 [Dendrobium catenatum]